MGIKDIEAKILTDTNIEAQKIKADYDVKLSDLKKQLEEEKIKQSDTILKSFKEKAKNTKISLITPHILSQKNEILSEKKKLFDSIFNECISDSFNLEPAEYKSIIKNLIKSLEKEENCLEIIPSKDKENITKESLEDLKKEDKGKWSKFHVSSQSIPIKGGFIVKGKNMELNFSFEILWQKVKEQYSEHTGQLLFEGN